VKRANLPDGFIKRYQALLGKQYNTFAAAQLTPLKKTIRVNLLRNSIDEFLEWAKNMHPDWVLTPHPFASELLHIDRDNHAQPLGKTLGHVTGRFYVQEASSCLPPLAMQINDQPLKILDMAAAPGSKTTHLAALAHPQSLLVANEFSASRSKALAFNQQRCGTPQTMLTHFSGEIFGKRLPGFFDRILIDAPCTGEGTFRKDKAALENWSPKRIGLMAGTQKMLIEAAFSALKPGGVLVYSTCTMAPEENEAVVTNLIEQSGGQAQAIDLRELFTGAERAAGLLKFEDMEFPDGEKMLRVWPHLFDSEGFFVAAVKKQNVEVDASYTKPKLSFSKKDIVPASKKKERAIREFFLENFAFELPLSASIFARNEMFFLVNHGGEQVIAKLRPDRPGIKLGKFFKDTFRIDHDVVMACGKDFTGKRVILIDEEQANDFFSGKNLPFDQPLPNGDYVLKSNDLPLGLAKKVEGTLKNNLPRGIVLSFSQ
jgi:16S rRNA (cytosine1407-C5)-methyltransferase